MGDKTKIEWTDATWNPVRGCSKVSAGCKNCYAERMAARFCGEGQPYEGLATKDGRWTGVAKLIPEQLDKPLRWKKPRRVFANSMSDLFHESLDDVEIAAVFEIMAAARQHVFQVLTKRPDRMRRWFAWATDAIYAKAGIKEALGSDTWPLPNVWLGVSAEDQKTADERVPLLLECPAAVRWVSYEPALGPLNLCAVPDSKTRPALFHPRYSPLGDIDWVVVGGESGPNARPAHPDWFRSVRDQCQAAGVAFLFKQWGAWVDNMPDQTWRAVDSRNEPADAIVNLAGAVRMGVGTGLALGEVEMYRVGKKRAGRELDGRTWDEYPTGEAS